MKVGLKRPHRSPPLFLTENLLACYIASRSDIDDVIPLLTAYQIEWNKLHRFLLDAPSELLTSVSLSEMEGFDNLAHHQISPIELRRLQIIWGEGFQPRLNRIKSQKLDLRCSFSAGLNEYRRATRYWWDNIATSVPQINHRPVYFISSNTHSIPNLLTGFALTQKERSNYLHTAGDEICWLNGAISTSKKSSRLKIFFTMS